MTNQALAQPALPGGRHAADTDVVGLAIGAATVEHHIRQRRPLARLILQQQAKRRQRARRLTDLLALTQARFSDADDTGLGLHFAPQQRVLAKRQQVVTKVLLAGRTLIWAFKKRRLANRCRQPLPAQR